VPPVIYVAMLAADFSVQSSMFAAMLAATVLFWMFGLVEEFVPALVAVVATLIIGLAPPNVALAGFASPSLLLLVGVYALSAVISSSGLSYRLMLRLLLRLPDKPVWHQVTLLGSGYLLSPLMPSTNARMSLLMPVYRDMVAGLRLPPRGPAITGLLAAMFGGALLFSPMMVTSKSSNIASLSLLPTQVQIEFSGLFWLVAAAVAALGVTAIHLLVLSRMFPTDREAPLPREHMRRQLADLGPLTPRELIAAGGFGFFVFGCATVGWHHVAPPYLAGCVLLALLLLMPALQFVPKSVMAAAVIVAVSNLFQPRQFLKLWQIDRAETLTAGITFAITLLTAPRIYWGVLTGVVVGLSHFLHTRLHPRIIEVGQHPDGSLRDRHLLQLPLLAPQVYALRMDAELDFAAASAFERTIVEHLNQHPEVEHVCLFAHPINRIDVTGVETFAQLHQLLMRKGITLHISGIKLPVLTALQKAGQLQPSAMLRLYRTDAEAIKALSALTEDPADMAGAVI
jgi:di/tricarboxylate transporter/anti-anti-sigma regulatory factor